MKVPDVIGLTFVTSHDLDLLQYQQIPYSDLPIKRPLFARIRFCILITLHSGKQPPTTFARLPAYRLCPLTHCGRWFSNKKKKYPTPVGLEPTASEYLSIYH